MALVPLIQGLDWRVTFVDATGNAFGTVGNPINVSGTGGTGMVVAGNLTNNNAAPAATNIGSLVALANAAAPTFTEGDQTLLSVNLAGALRTINTPSGTQTITGSVSVSNFPATQPISGTVTANQGTSPWTTQGALALGVSAGTANPFVVAGQNGGNVKLLAVDGSGQPTVNQGAAGAGGTSGWFTQGQSGIGAGLAGAPFTIGILDGSAHVVVPVTAPSGQATTGSSLLGVGPLFQAFAYGTNPASVAVGQFAFPPASRTGIPFTHHGHPNNITVTTTYTAAQTNAVVVANTAGTKLVVTSFMVNTSNSNSVNVSASLGLAQTVTPPTGTIGRLFASGGIAPGSGGARTCFQSGADGDQVLFTCGVPTGGDINVTIQYHTSLS
jgi:hypothetical protein